MMNYYILELYRVRKHTYKNRWKRNKTKTKNKILNIEKLFKKIDKTGSIISTIWIMWIVKQFRSDPVAFFILEILANFSTFEGL